MLARSSLCSALLAFAACTAVFGGASAEDCGPPTAGGRPAHAIAMHGDPALPKDFTHFPYANPAAPQGGRLTLGLLGSFDSLNPFIVKGLPVQEIRGYVVESLLTRGQDEPFTLYGLLARCVETDEARSFVAFEIHPDARFADGTPVTAEDVAFSFELLRDKGRPNYRTYYAKVTGVDVLEPRAVRFRFAQADRELPLILGLMPVLSKSGIDPAHFDKTSFRAPPGSGPYIAEEVVPGTRVTLRKNAHYWGQALAVNRGFWNFDEIRLDYYRDGTSQSEAFNTGAYDVRSESDPGRWQHAYSADALREGRLIKDAFTSGLPQGMNAFVFNTRRTMFADIRVREALALLFDFEWANRTLYFGAYRRTDSYFANSELSAAHRQADAQERELLAPFPGAVRADVLAGTWPPAGADGSGRDRARLRRALSLLGEADWRIVSAELQDKSGKPFRFEILVTTRDQERLALAFARDLRRAGITPRIRVVDATQYERRRQTFDFDMIQYQWGQSLSPGNEQSFYWGQASADQQGSRNYMGVRSAAIDATIEAMLNAKERPEFVSAVRALDRVLLSGFYVVPLFYAPEQWVARWSTIKRPERTSLYGYVLETWWREAQAQ